MLSSQFSKPVYAVTTISKLYMHFLQGFRLKLERHLGISAADDEKIEEHLKVENVPFPPEYINHLVTEKGLIKHCHAA